MMFRSITIGVTTPYNNCVDFLDQFIDNFGLLTKTIA